MKHILLKSLAASSLMVFTFTCAAQAQDRDDQYRHADRDASWWRGKLFERVRDDINHVQTVTPYFSGDQFRLVEAKRELDELQTKYADHGYDSGAMDDVIGTLQRVVSDNHLSGRDRDMLNEDLNHLRDFRDHHEGYR